MKFPTYALCLYLPFTLTLPDTKLQLPHSSFIGHSPAQISRAQMIDFFYSECSDCCKDSAEKVEEEMDCCSCSSKGHFQYDWQTDLPSLDPLKYGYQNLSYLPKSLQLLSNYPEFMYRHASRSKDLLGKTRNYYYLEHQE
jgi:hypothetical protein